MESIERLFTVDLVAGVLLCGEIDGICRRLAVFFGGAGAGAKNSAKASKFSKAERPFPRISIRKKENPSFAKSAEALT